MTPQRIQRKRTRGWKMPENTVYVGRPTKWGNPWALSIYDHTSREDAVRLYREAIDQAPFGRLLITRDDIIRELKGKNLACWCDLDRPCHADVLLELANADTDLFAFATLSVTPDAKPETVEALSRMMKALSDQSGV